VPLSRPRTCETRRTFHGFVPIRPKPGRPNRAYTLIVSVSILALLGLLGTVFVTVAQIEARVSETYVDQVRARMLAVSGVDRAIAELRSTLRTRPWSDPRPVAAGGDPCAYRNDDAGPRRVMTPAPPVPVDVGHGIPLAVAQNPSCETASPPPAPPGAAASGDLAGTYLTGGDYYILKVLDTTSQLNLNLYGGPTAPEHDMDATHLAVYRNLLARLGEAIAAQVPDPPGFSSLNPLEAPDIQAIAQARGNRPPGQPRFFATKEEVRAVFTATYAGDPARGTAKWEKLRDFIAVAGIRREEGIVGGVPAGYQGTELSRPVSGSDRGLNPAEGSWTDRREPLVPVNVNTAPYPVLYAVIAGGLSARAMRIETPTDPYPRPGIGSPAILRKPPVPPITDAEASTIARALVLARQETFADANGNREFDPGESFTDLDGDGRYEGPFRCFRDLMEWAATPAVHALLGGSPEVRRQKWAMLFANFNPNTLYNKANLDWPAPRGAETWVDLSLVDRTDLHGWTTFLVFGPLGFFEIESIGRVTTDAGGNPRVVAEKGLTAVVRIGRTLHHTSQRDWESAAVASNALSHPESLRDLTGSFHPGAGAGLPVLEYDGRVEISGENAPAPPGSMVLRFQDGFRGPAEPLDPAPSPRRDEVGGAFGSKTVLLGGDLLPDGTLSRTAAPGEPPPDPEALYYSAAADGNVDLMQDGSFEFFVKLMTRGDEGTDEAWVFIVQDDREHDDLWWERHDLWIAHKLERFGGAALRLVSTRFYLEGTELTVNSPLSPWPMAFSERAHDISGWRAHEWHHVSVSWRDAGLEGGASHVFRVDGDARAVEFDLPAETFEEGGGVNGGDKTTRNLFTLGSNATEDRLSLGGYSIRGNSRDIYVSFSPRGISMGDRTLHRFVAATMDEFVCARAPAPAAPPARFPTAALPGPGAATHRGRFTLPPDLPAGSELAAIAWTCYLPRAWGATPIPSPAIDVAVRFRGFRGGKPATDEVGVSDPRCDGRGVPILPDARPCGAGTAVEYEFSFLSRGSRPLMVTPILDDVSLTVLTPPRAAEWVWRDE